MQVAEFLRTYEVRSSRIMWFLGAGTSVSAGIPSAWNLIWEFKRKIYCSEQRVHPALVSDLGNPSVRSRIQQYLDSKGRSKEGQEDEYSTYFEATYSSERDRRAFLEEFIKSKQPSIGHYVLAHLMKAGRAEIVWTTNFDKLVEEAAARVYGNITTLMVADLGEPNKANLAISEQRWPLLVKLHGDFHSDRLKNTAGELRHQDETIREKLLAACKQGGLAVAGYSGRDSSVMDVFEKSVQDRGFPAGLFWFCQSSQSIFPRVRNLIENARANGIQAELIEVATFDELMSDIARFIQDLDQSALARLFTERSRLVEARVPSVSNIAPYIRTNALPIISIPSTCRLIECEIGGYEEVQAALAAANVSAIAQRCAAGVIAFGRDDDIKRAFAPFGIRRIDLHTFRNDVLLRTCGEQTLLYEAFVKALSSNPGIAVTREYSKCVVTPIDEVAALRTFSVNSANPITAFSGNVPGAAVRWQEAVTLKFDNRSKRNWLLLAPRVLIYPQDGADTSDIEKAKEFVREKTALRRNREYAATLQGWIETLFGASRGNKVIQAFGTSEGLDAVFDVGLTTGFSGRL